MEAIYAYPDILSSENRQCAHVYWIIMTSIAARRDPPFPPSEVCDLTKCAYSVTQGLSLKMNENMNVTKTKAITKAVIKDPASSIGKSNFS